MWQGFATKREVGLHNSSPVPVAFALTILQDGTQSALTHQEFTRSATASALVGDPQEFAIVPSEGVVGPDSFQRIEVRLYQVLHLLTAILECEL